MSSGMTPGDDEGPSLVWQEQQSATTSRFAALRVAGATDAEMNEALAATLVAVVLYALAYEGSNIHQLLGEANARLPINLRVREAQP